jgi:hypothetical protein
VIITKLQNNTWVDQTNVLKRSLDERKVFGCPNAVSEGYTESFEIQSQPSVLPALAVMVKDTV